MCPATPLGGPSHGCDRVLTAGVACAASVLRRCLATRMWVHLFLWVLDPLHAAQAMWCWRSRSSRWSIEKWFQLEHHQPAHVRCGPIRYALSIEAMAFVNQSKRDGQPLSPRCRSASSSSIFDLFGVFSRGVRGWHSTFCRLVGGVNSVSGVAMHLVGPIRCSCGTSGMELARSCDGFVYAMPLAGLPPGACSSIWPPSLMGW